MQVFFILFSVHFAVYQYINSKCLYRTHVNLFSPILLKAASTPNTTPTTAVNCVLNSYFRLIISLLFSTIGKGRKKRKKGGEGKRGKG